VGEVTTLYLDVEKRRGRSIDIYVFIWLGDGNRG
jgi:hypothetical protein